MKQRAPRAGRHPARRVALQTLFEIDFNRADAKETWQRGSFRTGLTDEAANFAWQLVEGVLEHRKELDVEIHQLADAERVCDRFVLLADGRLQGQGTMEELRERSALPGGTLEDIFLALT